MHLSWRPRRLRTEADGPDPAQARQLRRGRRRDHGAVSLALDATVLRWFSDLCAWALGKQATGHCSGSTKSPCPLVRSARQPGAEAVPLPSCAGPIPPSRRYSSSTPSSRIMSSSAPSAPSSTPATSSTTWRKRWPKAASDEDARVIPLSYFLTS